MIKKIIYGLLKKMKFLPQKFYVKIYYEYYSGNKLDYNDLKDFNEKISWYKVFFRPKILNKLVDKYNVKAYVQEKVGPHILNETIGVYEKVSEIDFDSLPNQFVIKGVHGFHFNLIVKDKTKLNLLRSKFLLNKWMRKNQYYRGGMEWAYKDVKPLLLIEKYLEEIGKDIINDYKFFCFNGIPKFVQVDLERGINNYRCYYDMQWKKQKFYTEQNQFYPGELKKPGNFEDMINVATVLSQRFPFVRVDLYSIEGKTIFGEMTFYPTDARKRFVPEEYNKIIGDYLILPKIPEGQNYITSLVT